MAGLQKSYGQRRRPANLTVPQRHPAECRDARKNWRARGSCCEYMVHNTRSVITYALLSPPPGRSPWSP
eukprot:4824686-Prymnesium_polylepis.1